jgi:hypothetical protein
MMFDWFFFLMANVVANYFLVMTGLGSKILTTSSKKLAIGSVEWYKDCMKILKL